MRGALLLYATQSFENNADGNFQKNILRAVAQHQPEQTAETCMRSAMDKARQTLFNGGAVPYGFKIINKRYAIDENEAPAVRMMFKLVLSGKTIPDIIEIITKSGYYTRDCKPFTQQTVHRILRSVKYKGTYLYNRKDTNHKPKVLRIKYDEVRIENAIPAVVKPDVFDKVQEMLCRRTPKSSPRATEPYLLTGLLKCGCCGKPMHGYSSFGGHSRKRYTRYTCKSSGSRNTCGLSIRQEYLERATAELIINVVQGIWNNGEIKTYAFNGTKKALRSEFNSLKSELNSSTKELNDLVKALANANDQVTREILSNSIKEANTIKKNKEARKEMLHGLLKDIDVFVKDSINNGLDLTVDELMKDTTTFKGLITLIIKDITVTNDSVTFNLNDLGQ